LRKLKKLEEAKSIYEKMLSINKNDATSWKGAGICWLYLEKYKEAVECFNNSINLNAEKISL